MIRNNPLCMLLLMAVTGCCFISCTKKEVYVNETTAPQPKLLQYIQNNFTFTLFYAALKKTGLDQVLEEKDSLTVLVPDNDAFKKQGINTVADIAQLNTDSLKKAIAYHILPVKVLYKDIPQTVDNEYPNLSGNTLYFSKPITPDPSGRNKGHVNGAAFTYVDRITKNGVVHVIDRLLKQPAPSVKALLDADTTYRYFVAALKKFGLYEQLDGPGPFTVLAVPNTGFTNWNISPDSIAKLDTLQWKKYLFGVYVLYPNRLFLSDFLDAPGTKNFDNGIGNYVFSESGVLYFQYLRILVYGYAKDYGTRFNPILGDGWYKAATFINSDNIAQNGVVQVMDKLIIYPSDMKKKR
ncbi:fasciclin domain-containing protein [Chitinophaga sp. 212800010-3]|uniref:fasciclin domain-containing protein n=1 Tax=unclassified Chitinophaga TaxID=2619133 RepID=UPI002DE39190|nr:hypothetical protein [Chitinophaga sp. 212800010-3]